jgi:hypothetical protein
MDRDALVIVVLIVVVACTCCSSYRLEKYISKNPKRAMIIVEPRPHKLLGAVIGNFHTRIPREWDLYVFHGPSHVAYAQECTRGIEPSRRVFLKPLETDNLTADEYNQLFKSAAFWDRVDADDILVFQTDAVTCSKSQWNIDSFTDLDYVGCAYDHQIGPGVHWGKDHSFYGSGGLSFRKKKFMMECIAANPSVDPRAPEDVFFSDCVEKSPRKPRDAATLGKFCTQNSYMEPSFGAHQIDKQLAKHHKELFLDHCPEANMLL